MRIQNLLALPAVFSPLTSALQPAHRRAPTNSTSPPLNYAVLLYPAWTVLDVFGPLNTLNGLIFEEPTLPFKLSILSATHDPVSSRPLAMQTASDFSESILVNKTFADVLDKNGTGAYGPGGGDIEVLLIPGGVGTFGNRSVEIDFVRELYPSLRYVITVCSGAMIPASAGILDGRKATTNKQSWDLCTASGPKVLWQPSARWVVDGNIWTSSGVSAGIDVMFAFVAEMYGESVADKLAKGSEYMRWTNASYDPFAVVWNTTGKA